MVVKEATGHLPMPERTRERGTRYRRVLQGFR